MIFIIYSQKLKLTYMALVYWNSISKIILIPQKHELYLFLLMTLMSYRNKEEILNLIRYFIDINNQKVVTLLKYVITVHL